MEPKILQLTKAENNSAIWVNFAHIVYFEKTTSSPGTSLHLNTDPRDILAVKEKPEDIAALLV